MNKKVYNIEISDDELTGIDLISIVDKPAIESNFIKLEEQPEVVPLTMATDKLKQYVTGAVLIPEKEIYRFSEKEGEYYIKFSAESIEKIRNKFFQTGKLKLSNLDHDSREEIQGNLIESWIVVDAEKDKAVALGFTDVKVGSLYATYHFADAATWEQVSQRNGFSLEGSFNLKPVELATVEETVKDALDEILDLLNDVNPE